MRSRILALLRQHRGTYVSGEDIARQLDVSRTAIWKHIRELRQQQYIIEAHSRRGYCLMQTPDLLLPDEVRAALHTSVLGRDVYYFATLPSTNNEAKELAALGAPHGALIVAEAQDNGRGRMARNWFSPVRLGIWMSIILRPPFRPMEAPKCTLMAAVAVVRAIECLCGIQCGIKWPNDILYDQRKLVGILTEMNAEMDAINYIVLGMGINVNIASRQFPTELAAIATSLQEMTGRPVARLPLLAEVMSQLEQLYNDAVANGFTGILDEWRRCSVTIGQTVDAFGGQYQISGVAIDIDQDGALLIETQQGIERVVAGDISIRVKT